MAKSINYSLKPVAFVRSQLRSRRGAPKQGREGGPEAWIDLLPNFGKAADGVVAGQEIFLFTWLHQATRSTLKVHPRSDKRLPLTGVFATRSPDRPNPIGLHRVKILEISGSRLRVGPLEAIDGTPVIDIKPILCHESAS
jgi:tRNA-Thr(GGU) m(6)t(6)A37 methyltransferase TsaA